MHNWERDIAGCRLTADANHASSWSKPCAGKASQASSAKAAQAAFMRILHSSGARHIAWRPVDGQPGCESVIIVSAPESGQLEGTGESRVSSCLRVPAQTRLSLPSRLGHRILQSLLHLEEPAAHKILLLS